MTPDERNNDIISEQTFSKEQSKSEVLDDRYKAVDAIEDREFAERDPLTPLAREAGFDELDSAISPQADSPGDSESDATTEFLLGLNFRPESEDAFEEDDDDDEIEDFEKFDKTVYAEQKSGSASETPSLDSDTEEKRNEMIREENARVVSAGRPSPRSDANSVTSTN